eukprot:9011440-Pyramimonas_sp.AAC.1
MDARWRSKGGEEEEEEEEEERPHQEGRRRGQASKTREEGKCPRSSSSQATASSRAAQRLGTQCQRCKGARRWARRAAARLTAPGIACSGLAPCPGAPGPIRTRGSEEMAERGNARK